MESVRDAPHYSQADPMILIGIDPGVTTGIAAWDADRFVWDNYPRSMSIIEAMDEVQRYVTLVNDRTVLVVVEDARKRKWGFQQMDENERKGGAGVREGVGSVKRDCSIWEEYLELRGIPYEMKHPVRTKVKDAEFRKLTGLDIRTNEHARDAGMIVFQINRTIARLKLETYRASHPGK